MDVDIEQATRCVPGTRVDASHISLTGPDRASSSAFDVDGILADSAAYSVAAVDHLGAHGAGSRRPTATIDLAHLLTFCTTHVEIAGEPVPAWADLSGVYPTLGGRHLQIHCNFAHHADGVVSRLGCAPNREAVAAAIAERDAFELEADLIADGMIGAAIRTLDEWDAHPHAAATRDLPLITVEQLSDADPIPDADARSPMRWHSMGCGSSTARESSRDPLRATCSPPRGPTSCAWVRTIFRRFRSA